MAEQLGSDMHTVSAAQLALVSELDKCCRQEGSTHAIWADLVPQAVQALGYEPGALDPSPLDTSYPMY